MAGNVALMMLAPRVRRASRQLTHLVEGVAVLQVHPGVCDLRALLHQGSQPFLLSSDLLLVLALLMEGMYPL